MLILGSFKASGSTFSHLHQQLLKSFNEAAISIRHLGKSEINIRVKTIFRAFRNDMAGSSFSNNIQIPILRDINNRILTFSGVRSIGIYIHIS